MRDRILSVITIIILVLSGLLLLSSGLAYFINLGNVLPIEIVQSYTGFALIGLSIILAILNLLLTRHPFYEYWLVIMIGSMVGVIYVA